MMRLRMTCGLALVALALWGCAMAPTGGERQEPPEDALTTTSLAPFIGPRPASKEPLQENEELLILERKKPRPKVYVPPAPQDGIEGWPESELLRGGSLHTRLQERIVPLPLEHTDVRAQLTFAIGSVTVTQQYHNPYAGKIEVVYTFPLPDDAAVRDFILQVGDRRIRGIIREREEATQIYLEARRQGHVASLMTQERPNIFTQRVANIEPGRRIDVSITYFHSLLYQDGEFTFVFPMVVGPRYNPAGFRDGVGAVPAGATGASGQKTEVQYLRPEEIALQDIRVEVAIEAGAEIGAITSPTHAIRAERHGPGQASVTLSPNDRVPNRDFVVRYRVGSDRVRAGFVLNRDGAGGTFAMMIHPPDSLAGVPRTPREMIFVIDRSGSMSGRPLEVAKRALVKCLKRLEADDTFQILEFSDHSAAFAPAPVAATPDNIRRGVAFTEALAAGGGTEMQEVVRLALDYPVEPGRRRIVAFMTDGYIGNDREVVAFARAHRGGARIFSFGVGDSVNRYLLEALARVGRGVSTFITLDESTEIAADELFQRVEHPALADLRIDWGGMHVLDVQPSPLPDLYLGRPVMVVGRFQGAAPTKVQISGRAGDRPFEASIAVDATDAGARHAALPAVWARTKISGLHDALLASGDSHEIAGEIRTLALRYGLLSEYTAFVAVDSLSRTAGEFGTTVVQPVPVPDGVQYSTTVEKR